MASFQPFLSPFLRVFFLLSSSFPFHTDAALKTDSCQFLRLGEPSYSKSGFGKCIKHPEKWERILPSQFFAMCIPAERV